MKRMALFAGGVGTVLVLLIAASALTSRHSGETPVVTADTRPVRVKPDDPGGMKIDQAENDLFSGGSDTGNAKLAPAAESPDTKSWRSATAVPPPVADAPPPAALAPPPPVAPASVATPKASVAPASVPMPKAAAAPAPKLASIAAPPVPAAPPAAVAPAATGRGASVQLAALTTEQAAHGEWQTLEKRMPDLLGSRQPIYSRIEHDGHTFWRVRTSGFSDVGQARGFCEKVRAKGAGCSVADF